MATYLPGVQPFVPQTQVFTPDYKFLQDVLSVRQDRYDTNFKEINKLYGEVVYAPLSHEKNKIKRDQYANALTNSAFRIFRDTGIPSPILGVELLKVDEDGNLTVKGTISGSSITTTDIDGGSF